MIRFLILTLAFSLGSNAWGVTKCIGPNGQITFQDAPCIRVGKTVAQDIQDRAAALAKEAAPKPLTQEDKVEIARSECGGKFPDYPIIGMEESAFRRCTYLGRFVGASSVNETVTALGTTKQFVFDQGISTIKYLYTRNGIVTAIQR